MDEAPIRKVNPENQRIYDRLAKLEARIIKLEEAVSFIRTCYLTPNVKERLDRIVGPEAHAKD